MRQHHWTHFHLNVPALLARHLAIGGVLESWALSIGLFIAAGAGAVAWWLLRRGCRGSGRTWAGRTLFGGAATLAVLGAVVGVNAYAGYVPTLGAAVALMTGSPAARPAPAVVARPILATQPVVANAIAPARTYAPVTARRSMIVDVALPAPALGMPNGNAYVYLPPGFSTSHHYPVLYLLGGAPGAPSDWLYAGNLQGIADVLVRDHYIQPFIIVMPRISPKWSVDYEGLNAVRGPQVMTYLTHVVVPAIDARYPTIPDRAARAIAGFSAGADASLNIALHNQSTFSVAGAIEPEGRPGAGAGWVLARNRGLIAANSPIMYIPTVAIPQPMAFYLSAGSHRSHGAVPTLARELRGRGVSVVVHNESGLGHTWTDARNDLPYLLQFVSQAITGL